MPVTKVTTKWSSGNFQFLEKDLGNNAQVHFGKDTYGIDCKMFGATTGAFALFDESGDILTFDKYDAQFGDTDFLNFGDAVGGDVNINWTGALLQISPAVDDTGSINVGDGTKDIDFKIFLGTAADSVLLDVGNKAFAVAGDVRIDLSGATVAAANTDGGVIKAGTSVAPVTEDTANMKFVSMYFDDGATSGEAVGLYDRLYVTGAGGSGQALRSFGTVQDVAGANIYGAHISASFGTTGSITGLGNALATTLHIPAAMVGGTYASQTVEVWADAATSNLAGATSKSFMRTGVGGDAAGMANLDTSLNLFDFYGVTAGSGKFIDTDKTTHAAYGGIRVYIPGVGVKWLALVSS